MNLSEEKYKNYTLTREMLETPDIIRNFDHEAVKIFAETPNRSKLLFTGEGSSRTFPAKRAVYNNYIHGSPVTVFTEGSLQSMEYFLDEVSVFGSSNSGRTKELISLMEYLRDKGHEQRFGLTSEENSLLKEYCNKTYVLSCGKEKAVAATKSVIEQALFYDALLSSLRGESLCELDAFADSFQTVLETRVSREIFNHLAEADMIYFAGRNNGVAEELALKTNEIIRKKSAYLEGTYAVHGIEEVMTERDVLVWIDPFENEIEKFSGALTNGVGVKIMAISSSMIPLPGFKIPDVGRYAEYIQLAAGWNLLVETGIAMGVDMDKPLRARKIGNEY